MKFNQSFLEQGESGAFADGMRAVPGIEKLLSEAEANVPTDVMPFVKARLNWGKVRKELKAQLMKLENAILAICQGEQFEGIKEDTKTMFLYLDGLDERLQAALDTVVNAADETKRTTLKGAARRVTKEYSAELDQPFFQDVDSKNVLTPVTVRATAFSALGEVDAVLARAA